MDTYRPFINVGPGEVIRKDLSALNWTQEDLARVMGMSVKAVNEIIKNKSGITLETARLLGKAFGQSPEFWLNLDAAYRLQQVEESDQERDIEQHALILKHMPVKEMIRKGWLKPYNKVSELVRQVKDFWNAPTIDFRWMEAASEPWYRKSQAYENFTKYYALTWYQMAKNVAHSRKAPVYRKRKLEELASKLAHHSTRTQGVAEFLHSLESCGVKFFVLKHLPKTYLDGASFRDGENPVVVYTCRFNHLDNFWFTLAHEIAHVILHLDRQDACFLDDMQSQSSEKPEVEADAYAAQLIKAEEIKRFCASFSKYISTERVQRCAEALQVGEALVVGVLQHSGIVPFKNLNRFKETVLENIPESMRVLETGSKQGKMPR